MENFEATWFIDPPYVGKTGERYKHKRSRISQDTLADFCISREGQVIVCDSNLSDYLPFELLYKGMSIASKKEHKQMVFSLENALDR